MLSLRPGCRQACGGASTSGRLPPTVLHHSLSQFTRLRVACNPPKHCCAAGRRPLRHRPAATAGPDSPGEVYSGVYGEWSVDARDKLEVTLYRGGLSVAAAAVLLDSALAFLPPDLALAGLLRQGQEVVAFTGAAGLGISLYFIHIYVTPLKRLLQLLWAAGLIGAVGIAATQVQPVPEFVASHPAAVWLVGPLFAAVTGLAFKEGLCYGKAEAAGLFGVVPLLLLGHLTQLAPPAAERGLLIAFATLFTVFAARKYTQAVKDDIGDKSVFQFQALSPAQQEARLAQLKQRQAVPPNAR